MNPYDELGVSVHATSEEIRQKYKTLAQIHHPDKGGDEETFKRIKFAYEILSDPIRRTEYDTTGKFGTDTSIKDEALHNLAQMLFGIIPNFNPEHDNLIQLMTNKVTELKQECTSNIDVCNNFVAHLNKIVARLKIKTDNENLLLGFVNTQIDMRKNEFATFTRRIQICDLQFEILKDYEYGLIELPGAPTEN